MGRSSVRKYIPNWVPQVANNFSLLGELKKILQELKNPFGELVNRNALLTCVVEKSGRWIYPNYPIHMKTGTTPAKWLYGYSNIHTPSHACSTCFSKLFTSKRFYCYTHQYTTLPTRRQDTPTLPKRERKGECRLYTLPMPIDGTQILNCLPLLPSSYPLA